MFVLNTFSFYGTVKGAKPSKKSVIVETKDPKRIPAYLKQGCKELSDALGPTVNIFECPHNVRLVKANDKKSENTVAQMIEPMGKRINDLKKRSLNTKSRHGHLTKRQDRPLPWGLDRIDQESLPLDKTFNPYYSNGGKGVNIYIIDSGIDVKRKEFGKRAEMLSNHVNDTEKAPYICNQHGTAVAGVAASKYYGVAPKAKIYGIRSLGCNGKGSVKNLIEGINSAVKHAKKNPRRAIINLSWGMPNLGAYPIATAIDAAIGAGMKVVTSAGNDGEDGCSDFPSSHSKVISVAASNQQDKLHSTSNWGTCVDIVAPGRDILVLNTTKTESKSKSKRFSIIKRGFNVTSGTSYASPFVAGVMALLVSDDDSYSQFALKRMLLKLSTKGKLKGLEGEKSDTPNKLLRVPSKASVRDACACRSKASPKCWSYKGCRKSTIYSNYSWCLVKDPARCPEAHTEKKGCEYVYKKKCDAEFPIPRRLFKKTSK